MISWLLALAASVSPPLRRAAFFDSQGAIVRGAAPPSSPRVYLPVHSGLSLIEGSPGDYRASFLTESDVQGLVNEQGSIAACIGRATEASLLGKRLAERCGCTPGDASLWVLDVSHRDTPPEFPGQWLAIRGGAGAYTILEGLQDDADAALLASARGFAHWHRSIPHCAKCGARTESKRAGRQRQCINESCGARFRPRIEPSILVLVVKGDKACLGRKASWPTGRYSTLAGFVELGETLEEAVVREVYEEVGLRVRRDSLRYVASQPWLFPSSLLVGFIAEADNSQLSIDKKELEDAGWYHRSVILERFGELPEPKDGSVHVPSFVSLAHTVVGAWLEDTDPSKA